MYEHIVTSIPFRRCDSSNFGVSQFCSLKHKYLLRPNKFAVQIEKEYESNNEFPDFTSILESSIRKFSKTIDKGDIFPLNDKTYDAYNKDIALVHIHIRKATVIQMGSSKSMGWVDFFSNVEDDSSLASTLFNQFICILGTSTTPTTDYLPYPGRRRSLI